MSRRKTHEEFVAEVKDKLGDGYEVIGRYTLSKNKIKMKHIKCGHEYYREANAVVRGTKCPRCNKKGKSRKTNKQFIDEVYSLVGDEYIFLEDYTLSNHKIKVRHNTCGNEYKITPNGFLRGNRCGKCHGNESKRKTTKQFKEEVYNLVGNEYSVLGEYISRSDDILIKHNVCGREYNVEPGNFLYKSRCIECYYDSIRLTTDEVISNINIHLGTSYRLKSAYTGAGNKVTLLHEECGNIFDVRYTDIVQRRSGCPHCSQSRGEQYVADYLKSLDIYYIYEKKFDDLRHIFQLSYDFYLPEYNILIEYQGEQHFRPKNFGNESKEEAEVNFQKQLIRDAKKRVYAHKNNYVLLEPNYKLDTYIKVADYLNNKFTLLEVTQGTLNQI